MKRKTICRRGKRGATDLHKACFFFLTWKSENYGILKQELLKVGCFVNFVRDKNGSVIQL